LGTSGPPESDTSAAGYRAGVTAIGGRAAPTQRAFKGAGRPQSKQQPGLDAILPAAVTVLQVLVQCAMQKLGAERRAAQPPRAAHRRAAEPAAAGKIYHKRHLHLHQSYQEEPLFQSDRLVSSAPLPEDVWQLRQDSAVQQDMTTASTIAHH
jgi:hypothetical protein